MRHPPEVPDDYAPFPPLSPLAPPPHLPDPNGMAVKHLHLKLNAWELGQVSRIARRECVPMTTLVRRVLRTYLFAEQKR